MMRMALCLASLNVLACGVIAVIGFSLVVTPTVYAQEGSMELGGRYVNQDAGVELKFPDGWSGVMTESTSHLQGYVTPGAFDGAEPTKSISLAMY
jgi:hypothetical protein